MARVMTRIREWLRPPRSVLILFVLVVCVPAATLITLGLRLLDQDRALARQRQLELLDRAADAGIQVLEQDLASQKARLADGSCGGLESIDDAVCITLRLDSIEAFPPNRIAYYPRPRRLKEAPAEAFAEIETHEFRAPVDLEQALEASHKLAASSDAAIRAGALLRRGRIFVKLGRMDEALTVLADLSRVASVSINDEPADLVARRMRCSILESHNRRDELTAEAASLARDVRAGKWQLDWGVFQHIDEQLHRWLGAPTESLEKQDAFATALAWAYDLWMREQASTASGVHVLNGDTAPVTIIWSFNNGKGAALIAGSQFLESHWKAELQKAVAPARVLLGSAGAPPIGDELRVQRSAADTGLPWTLIVATPPGQREPREFTERDATWSRVWRRS
jgi:hypothetical protein